MSHYDEARMHATRYLTQAIEAHERGEFLSVGRGFDEFDRMLPRQGILADDLLCITLEFWASWWDAAEHTWKFYPDFGKDDWPNLARVLLEDLKVSRKITDRTLLDHFVRVPRSPKRSLLERVTGLVR